MAKGLEALSDAELDQLVAQDIQKQRKPMAFEAMADSDLDALIAQEMAKESMARKAPDSGIVDNLQAGLEGFGKAVTFGALPRLQAAAAPAVNVVREALGGAPVELPSFEQRVAENVARQEEQAAQMPVSTLAGELPGYLVGGGLAGGAVRAAGRALLPQAAAGLAEAGLAGRVATAAGEGAALGGLGAVASDKDIAEEVKSGAAISGAFPVAGKALSMTPKLGKMALGSVFGVRQKTIDNFLANSDQVMKAKSFEDIKDLASKAVDDLKQVANKEKFDAIDAIEEGLVALKAKGLNIANEGLELLGQSSLKVKKNDLIKDIIKQKANYKIQGREPIGESAKDALRKLENLQRSFEGLDDEVSAVDLKNVLKQLDQDIEFIQVPGTFVKNLSQRALMGVRDNIDQRLKTQVPGYGAKMSEASKTFRLLEESAKKFGKREQADVALSAYGKPEKVKDKILKDFVQEAGVDLEKLRAAQENAKSFQTWSEMGVENKIKNLMNDRTIEIKRQFEKLSKLSDTDFVKEVENLSALSDFDKAFQIGSRNVNLWTVLGAGGGAFAGGAFLGGMGGAAIGALMDKHGPKAAKKILEGVVAIKGMPTVKKIAELELPKGMKDDLINAFRAGIITSKYEMAPTKLSPEEVSYAKEAVMNRDDYSDLERAREMSSLNRRGEILNLKKYVEGGVKTQPQEIKPLLKKERPNRSIEETANFVKFKKEYDY